MLNMNKNLKNNLKRGDVVFMDLPKIGESSVQCGLRPCVIMSNQKAIDNSTVITVVPVTSKHKRCENLHIPLFRESGLSRESIALAEQILTVPKSLITKKVGTVPEFKMKAINNVIINQMQLA